MKFELREDGIYADDEYLVSAKPMIASPAVIVELLNAAYEAGQRDHAQQRNTVVGQIKGH